MSSRTDDAPHDRRRELLAAASEAMRDGRDPFDSSFLVRHRVTYDEAHNMAENIAAAVDFFLLAVGPRPS